MLIAPDPEDDRAPLVILVLIEEGKGNQSIAQRACLLITSHSSIPSCDAPGKTSSNGAGKARADCRPPAEEEAELTFREAPALAASASSKIYWTRAFAVGSPGVSRNSKVAEGVFLHHLRVHGRPPLQQLTRHQCSAPRAG